MLVFAALLTGCGASSKTFDSSTTGTGTTATVTSISVEPANSSLPRGLTRQFTATATYSNGTKLDVSASVTWASSVTNIATITGTGVVTALNVGTTTITAAIGTVTGSATLTVSAATLVSINVTPVSPTIAKGTFQLFTATGIYTDNSTQNISTSVTWSSSNLFVATISNAPGSIGLATGVSGGKSTITAALNGATGSTVLTVSGASLVSISVTPANPSIPLGNTQQFIATGVYSDASTQPLTTAVTWSSSSPAATISNAAGSQGLARATAVGTTTISAAVDGLTGTATLTVTPASLVSIAVTPVNPSIPAGLTVPFTATGTYSDGTTQDLTGAAMWNSANPAVATITNTPTSSGIATGVAAGTSIITATVGNIVSAPPVTLNVTAAQLVSIAVTPANPTIVNGATEQFVATGTYTDGAPQVITTSVTWTSGTTTVASISNGAGPPSTQGLATAASPSTTLITATYHGTTIAGSTTLKVINAFAYAPNIDCVGTNTSTVSEYSVGPTGALTPLITTNSPTGSVAAGNCPFAIGITPNNAYAYVANSNGNNVAGGNTLSEYAINADGSLSLLPMPTIATGANPNSVNIDPSGTYVYVANFGGNTTASNTVSEYVIGVGGELTSLTPFTVVAGSEPAAVAINPAGTYAYVANFGDNSISQYTIANGVLTPMAVPTVTTGGLNEPNYIVVDPTGHYVYAPNFNGPGTISQYSIGPGGALAPLTPPVATSGSKPRYIAIDATGTYAYTADSFVDQVSQFTIVGGVLTPMTPANVTTGVGSHPNGLTIDATGKYLYVADRGTNAISLFSINPANGSLTPLVPAAPATNPEGAGTFPTNIATTP
jgi:6-phosphogluconolactonase (cycloisomerase 2 family)